MDDTGKCLMFNVRDNVWRCSESSTLAALAGLESLTPAYTHRSLNRQRVWDSPHFLIEKIE